MKRLNFFKFIGNISFLKTSFSVHLAFLSFLIIITFQIITVNELLSSPTNTMSLQYAPNPNESINSASYKSEENHQNSTFNSHNHTDITQLGTITAGTWQGTAVDEQFGGIGSNFSSTAQGSILYFSGTGVISALAAGTSGHYLQTQGAGANPTWATGGVQYTDTRYKMGTFTRDMTAATGTASITGVGFQPVLLYIIGTLDSAEEGTWGFSDATSNTCMYQRAGGTIKNGGTFAGRISNADNSAMQDFTISAMGADGFTVSYTKTGSPTGTATFQYMAYR